MGKRLKDLTETAGKKVIFNVATYSWQCDGHDIAVLRNGNMTSHRNAIL